MSFRRVDSRDAPSIGDILAVGRDVGGRETGDARAAELLSAIRDPSVPVDGVMVEVDGAPAGVVVWHFAFNARVVASGAYLCLLSVARPYRGHGVEVLLVRAAARAVQEAGGSFLVWHVPPDPLSVAAFEGLAAREPAMAGFVADGLDFTALAGGR